MTEFNFGESIQIQNTFTDINSALYDPGTVTLEINNAEGALQSTVTFAGGEIVRDSVGVYHYDYLIPAISTVTGYWLGIWTASSGVNIDKSENQFYVRPIGEKLYISVNEVKAALITDKITMDDATIRQVIRAAMEEISTITGRLFTNANEETEYFSTLTPNPNTQLNQLFLSKLPVQSITSLSEYDTSKTLVKTYDPDDYYLNDNGIITLMSGFFGKGIRRVECVYSQGYTAIPGTIKKLTGVLARIDVMINYVMSTDDASTGFTVDGIGSVSIGEPYVSSIRILERLEKQKKELVAEIGNLRNDVFIC